MSYKDGVKQSISWVEKMNKKAGGITETEVDTEVVL